MNAKTAIDRIIGKGGLKLGSSRADGGLEKGKREGAAPRRSMEELATGKGRTTEPERSELLQVSRAPPEPARAASHGEIQNLKDKLRSKTKTSEVAFLQNQLEEKTKEAERREQLLCSLSEEINRLKCNLSAVMAKCSNLENEASGTFQEAATNSTEIERQLKDALEKNQQWLLYDQQREAYVRGLLGRIFELEQKAEIVSQQESKSNSEGHPQEEKQECCDQLFLTAKRDAETERRTITQLRSELNELKKTYQETQGEMMSLNALLQSQQRAEMKTQENENTMKEKAQRLEQENETIKEQLREEKEKSEDLLCQVQLLRKSLLRQEAEHTRIALLEQQIQICTTDLENGKLDRHNLKLELNHVLKELRKAKEKITRLEPLKLRESGHMESQEDLQAVFDKKLTTYDRSPPLKHSSCLDESFLECPR
ncbi:hypothetical protein EK904_009102, partial [Melospiza melodia maxima]